MDIQTKPLFFYLFIYFIFCLVQSRINILYFPHLIGLSMQFPLNELSVILCLCLANINCFIAESIDIVLLCVDGNFFDSKLLALLIIISLLNYHRPVLVVVAVHSKHLLRKLRLNKEETFFLAWNKSKMLVLVTVIIIENGISQCLGILTDVDHLSRRQFRLEVDVAGCGIGFVHDKIILM